MLFLSITHGPWSGIRARKKYFQIHAEMCQETMPRVSETYFLLVQFPQLPRTCETVSESGHFGLWSGLCFGPCFVPSCKREHFRGYHQHHDLAKTACSWRAPTFLVSLAKMTQEPRHRIWACFQIFLLGCIITTAKQKYTTNHDQTHLHVSTSNPACPQFPWTFSNTSRSTSLKLNSQYIL